ncbi:hypothetical protein BDR26DRAFT_860588 [Obelidium mucronatum]|nr:hypothetical protein BDR26DRAFT_860588 [Obelidium mucronatum]
MEFVMHICGVTDVYSFKTKFERLLQHNPFQAKPDVHQYQSQESVNAGPEKLQHQELSIGENGSPHPRRLDETSISQDTLRLSSTNTLSSPFNIEEGKLTAAESAALSGDGEDLTTAPLSLAIAHDLTKLMNGNTSIITGIKRVTLHFRIPVEICSTAQVLSSASGGSSYGSNPRPAAAAAAAATAAAASWRYKRIGAPVSVPPSACNSPVNCVLDLFPGEVNSVQPIRRPSSILKEGSGPRRSSTVSKKTVRIQVAE